MHVSLSYFGGRELLLQDQLRQAKESVVNMQKLHEIAQSQLFELRTQSGNVLMMFHFFIIFSLVNFSATIVTTQIDVWSFIRIQKSYQTQFSSSEEERAAKESEVNLLMDEVERAQTRLVSLEREKVNIWSLSRFRLYATLWKRCAFGNWLCNFTLGDHELLHK